MKRILCCLTALAVLLTVFAVFPATVGAAAKQPLELHVEGRYIYNSAGEQVRLTGANIPDLQWATGGDNDLDKRVDMLCDQWNGNVVRLCVHSKFWFGEEWYQNKNYSSYRKKIDHIIEKVSAKGKYVILNLHEFYAVTEKNKRFWEEAAETYKNNPAVLFGLLNEPHDISWDVWRNGGTVQTTDEYGAPYDMPVYGFQQILEMIRNRGAKNMVVVGGLDWAYYFNGISRGYDGLEYGYRLQEPEGEKAGNGIMYDTHIYPMKPEYNPVEKAVDCVVDEVPILVGEFGHWGEFLFDWYDNYECEEAYIWMNEILDYIDRNQLNYTCWSFHIGAAPAMFTSYDTFEPTKHSGLAMKHEMIYNIPDTRPPEEQRGAEDPTPLATWEYVIDFEDESCPAKVYGDAVQIKLVKEGYEGGGLLVNFDIPAGGEGKSAAIYELPEGTNLSGAEWLSLRIKGDGDMRDIGIGLELKDGRQFLCTHPIDLFTNWKLLFLPFDAFRGEAGLLDGSQIKSVFFTSLTPGPGSFTVDNVMIAGNQPKKQVDKTVSDQTESEKINWHAWEDSESVLKDSFTLKKTNQGKVNHSAFEINYNRPKGSYGGQAKGVIPTSWDLRDTKYFTFWAKGDGSDQIVTIRFDCDKGTNLKDQTSNFKKREFKRFATDIKITGSDWKFYKIRYSDLGGADMLHENRIRNIDIFNRVEEKQGSFIIDDFSFTNVPEELEPSYTTHEAPRESSPVGEVRTTYPKDEIVQIPKTFILEAGTNEYINIHLMNKTDKDAKGTLRVEGLPDGKVMTTEYETFAHYVSYPHYPWREMSLSNFKVNFPASMVGDYTIKVTEVTGNGVLPQEYTLKVVPPGTK